MVAARPYADKMRRGAGQPGAARGPGRSSPAGPARTRASALIVLITSRPRPVRRLQQQHVQGGRALYPRQSRRVRADRSAADRPQGATTTSSDAGHDHLQDLCRIMLGYAVQLCAGVPDRPGADRAVRRRRIRRGLPGSTTRSAVVMSQDITLISSCCRSRRDRVRRRRATSIWPNTSMSRSRRSCWRQLLPQEYRGADVPCACWNRWPPSTAPA
ncbi:MAG: hypothetical protein MZV70_41405 [Desulfobacterales bacterium]|nr:hypothetical protein [Desulfobacterales bacterium]